MLSEYGMGIDYWLNRPFAQVFALYSAISARYGNKAGGPTYAERAMIAAMRAAAAKETAPAKR